MAGTEKVTFEFQSDFSGHTYGSIAQIAHDARGLQVVYDGNVVGTITSAEPDPVKQTIWFKAVMTEKDSFPKHAFDGTLDTEAMKNATVDALHWSIGCSVAQIRKVHEDAE